MKSFRQEYLSETFRTESPHAQRCRYLLRIMLCFCSVELPGSSALIDSRKQHELFINRFQIRTF